METIILKKKPHPLVTCAVIVFVLLGVVAAGIVWAIAATGLVTIPVFTRLAYEVPTPLRVVTPGVPIETYIQSEVSDTLMQRLYQGQGALEDTALEVSLSEQSFTASLRSLAEQAGEGLPFDFSLAQVALDPQKGAEIFLPIKNNPQQTALRLDVYATVQDGGIILDIKGASIGSLSLPLNVLNPLIHTVVEKNLESLYAELGSYVRLSEISYEDGLMILKGELAVETSE